MSDHRFADEAEAPINGDVIFVAKARDRNIDLRLAIRSGASFGELHSPARIHVFLRCLCGLVGPDLLGCLARLDRVLLILRVALLGSRDERCVNDLSPHGKIARGA